LEQGWYHFRCSCIISYWETDDVMHSKIPLSQALGEYASMNPRSSNICNHIIREYLMHKDGCNLSSCYDDKEEGGKDSRDDAEESIGKLIEMIAILYNQMLSGEGMMSIMHECT
jgi:hypothetical protein